MSAVERKTACVTGGSGYIASALIKMLLQKGYAVKTTVRNPDDMEKNSHFKELQALGPLKIFRADLEEEGSFDEAVAGCDYAFLVAAPMDLKSQNPEKELLEAGVQGTLNVLRSCVRAGTVKLVILTSSAAAVSGQPLQGDGNGSSHVLDESSWSDLDYLRSTNGISPAQAYAIAKVLSEKEASKLAEENGISLVAVCPVATVGASPAPVANESLANVLSLLSGDEEMMNILKGIEKASGWSMPMVHIEDVCRAEIFIAEEESASGRCICGSLNTTVTEIAGFLAAKYPQYNVRCDCIEEHLPEKPTISLSSAKLIGEGFEFKYKNLDEMYDDLVAYGKALGLIPNLTVMMDGVIPLLWRLRPNVCCFQKYYCVYAIAVLRSVHFLK
uniref:NAD-dependent epimerase/dehydratase domain-containing protein n=1 Tax=Oryza meridionalis TaxID=40149 RepID=A0A0E0DIR3_9ORYZ